MQKSALVWQKHLLQKNTTQVLKSFVPFISLQRMQDAECRYFSAINFSAYYFPVANLPEFRLQTWLAREARAGSSVVKNCASFCVLCDLSRPFMISKHAKQPQFLAAKQRKDRKIVAVIFLASLHPPAGSRLDLSWIRRSDFLV